MRPDPDQEIATWWSQEYPAITDSNGVRQAILEAGYRVIDSFVMPAEAWWKDYYSPMEARIPEFLEDYGRDEIAQEILSFTQGVRTTHLVLGIHFPGVDPGAVQRSMELFAKEVMPALN